MRRAWHAFAGLALLFLAVGAFSQGFPSKPVHMVVLYPPGGGADTLARIMEPKLARIWAQPIVVENRHGASGHIGADFVAKSAPDGHTLLMSSTASLTEKNVNQFAPVSLVSASAYIVTANPGVAAADIRELIALAKANPGKLSFGSSGTGAASHLSAELFKAMAGVDLLHVPYKGPGQALTDLLAGHVNLMFAPSQTVMPYVHAGKLRALAVTGSKRSETLPDLPTVGESGLPHYEAVGWFGLLAPAATPKDTVAKLSAEANRVLAMSDVREKMLGLGADPAGNTPEEFARFIRDDQAKWSKLMKEAAIQAEERGRDARRRAIRGIRADPSRAADRAAGPAPRKAGGDRLARGALPGGQGRARVRIGARARARTGSRRRASRHGQESDDTSRRAHQRRGCAHARGRRHFPRRHLPSRSADHRRCARGRAVAARIGRAGPARGDRRLRDLHAHRGGHGSRPLQVLAQHRNHRLLRRGERCSRAGGARQQAPPPCGRHRRHRLRRAA